MKDDLWLVKRFMSASLLTFSPHMEVIDAVRQLVERGVSGAPVIDAYGNLVGMLTEHDCLRVVINAGYYGDWGGQVHEFMHKNVETVSVDMGILEVARLFTSQNFRRYPVVDGNRLAGQISRHDLLKALISLSSGQGQRQ